MTDQITVEKKETKAAKKAVDKLEAAVDKKQEEDKVVAAAKAEETAAKAEASAVVSAEPKTVTWQFRYKKYKEIIGVVDPTAPKLLSGRKVMKCVTARNFRLDLDLTNPEEKEIHEHLLKSNQRGSSFWMVKSVNRDEDTIKDRAVTLRKLYEMPTPQLLTFFTGIELQHLGLLGSPSREELIMAIIDNKKLVQ